MSKNERSMQQGTCAVCGSKKSTFMKNSTKKTEGRFLPLAMLIPAAIAAGKAAALGATGMAGGLALKKALGQ